MSRIYLTILLSYLFTAPLAWSVKNPHAIKNDSSLREWTIEYFKKLKSKDSLFYYQSWRLESQVGYSISYSRGELQDSTEWSHNMMAVDSRVGSRELDNTAPLQEHFGGDEGSHLQYLELPIEYDSLHLIPILQRLSKQSYRSASQQFKIVQSNYELRPSTEGSWYLSPRDSILTNTSSIHTATASSSLEPNMLDSLKTKLQKLSLTTRQYPWVIHSSFNLEFQTTHKFFWDTEDTHRAGVNGLGRLQLSLQTQSPDGMVLNHFKEFPLNNRSQISDFDALTHQTQQMLKELELLRKSPKASPYSGPILLAPEAAAVFIHEVLGHRLESHRLKQGFDGQTFRKQLNQSIMDQQFTLTDNPLRQQINSTTLNGHYTFDDQGVPAKITTLIDKGILKGFLESRSTSSQDVKSNGHGRGNLHLPSVSRMGNTILETDQGMPWPQLIKQFKTELQNQKKEFGYLFRNLTGGFTSTSKGSPQSFKLTPLMAWKVYADDRADELVRGLDLVGTPLVSLKKIIAASDSLAVFNGFCGAESGWVPVSSSAPALLFKELEVESQYVSPIKALEPFLPSVSVSKDSLDKGLRTLNIIDQQFRTLQQKHAHSEVQVQGIQADLWLSQVHKYSYESGHLAQESFNQTPELDLQLIVGKDSSNQLYFQGNYIFDSPIQKTLPISLAPELTEQYFYYQLNDLYLREAETFSQKKSYLNNQPQESPQLEVYSLKDSLQLKKDWRECPSMDSVYSESFFRNISNNPGFLLESKLELGIHNVQHFGKYNSSHHIQNVCEYTLVYSALVQDSTGELFWDYHRWSSPNPSNFDSTEFKQGVLEVHSYLKSVQELPSIDFYRGPVIFSQQASGYFFHQSLVETQLALSSFNQLGATSPELLFLKDKKILPREFNIIDLPQLQMIHGTPLYGTYQFDHLGDSAQSVQLVKAGQLNSLYQGLIPHLSIKGPNNGHYRYNDIWPGNLLINHQYPKDTNEFYQRAFQLASEEGLDSILIIEKFPDHDAFKLLSKKHQSLLELNYSGDQGRQISFNNPVRMSWLKFSNGQRQIAKPMSLLPLTFTDLRLVREVSKHKSLYQPYAAYSLYSPDVLHELINLRKRPTQWVKP